MKINRKTVLTTISAFLILALATHLLQRQYGLVNYGQEFGTYGQYNRVVRLVKEREEYRVLNHGLSRDLNWRNLDHLNRFYVILKNARDQEFTIEFVEETEEMNEKNETILNQIIERKISEQVSADNADKPRV
ncbi:MAG: hypothetical protein O7C75_14195 [Verrucomicrobia bacterium]|nr:hypothetical protein [Verrucomicrobiota bacterium]